MTEMSEHRIDQLARDLPGIQLDTIGGLCEVLDMQPGDLIQLEEESVSQ